MWADDPAKRLYRDTRLACVLQAVAGNPKDRAYTILYNRYVTGMSVNDIAEEFGMKPNAVTLQIGYYKRKLLKAWLYRKNGLKARCQHPFS